MGSVIVKPYGHATVDVTVPDNDDLRTSTHIYGDVESVVFETTDHEGHEVGDSWELTWPEIYAAVQAWGRR